MKRTMKRSLALVTVLAMLLSVLAMPAFAVDAGVAAQNDHPYHSYTEFVAQRAPSCTEKGFVTYKCACGAEETIWQDSFGGHAYATVEDTDPTCTEIGVLVEKCTVCDYVKTTETPAHGHNYVASGDSDATCTQPGTHSTKCTHCGDVQTFETSVALGHNYYLNSWTAEKATVACRNCTEKFEVAIKAEADLCACGINPVLVGEKAATCTTIGLKVSACTACGHLFAVKTADAHGHDAEADWVEDEDKRVEPDGLNTGMKYFNCAKCNTLMGTEVIEAEYDIFFSDSISNATKAMSTVYVNKSMIAYTISLNAINKNVDSLRIKIAYDSSKLELLYIEDNTNIFGENSTQAYGSDEYVTVMAYNNSYLDGELVPTVLNGEQEFVTLYFRIKGTAIGESADAKATTFSLSIADVEASYGTPATEGESYSYYRWEAEENVKDVAVAKLADLNGDGVINMEDQAVIRATIAKMIKNESMVAYDIRADIDQDGDVDVTDLVILDKYLLAAFDYEEFVDCLALPVAEA